MTPSRISPTGRALALLAALLGWMFDGMEMGLFPLVADSALPELMGTTVSDALKANRYGVIMAGFLVGAATGGVLFGWLGDKIGRVRAMMLSVFAYSICSGLSAFSTEVWHLATLRFLGALGMGGEWALGVALVMEVWPGASRAWLAGWIGAFGNLGYTLCGLTALGLNQYGSELPGWLTQIGLPQDWATKLTANQNWRLLLLLGSVPALLTLFIQVLVPESEKWKHEKESGKASFWSGRDLIGVLIGATAACALIVLWYVDFNTIEGFNRPWPADMDLPVKFAISAVLLVIVLFGYLHPARSYLGRSGLPAEERRRTLGRMLLAAGLSGIPLLCTWAGVMWMYKWVGSLPDGKTPDARPWIQISSSLGAAVGCLIGAVLCTPFGRRPVYATLCILSGITVVSFYQLNTRYDTTFVLTAGVMGLVTAAFYGWLPLYLPELFPTAVRATGQGFGFNFGRIIAACANLQMANLLALFDGKYEHACALTAAMYGVGLVLIFFAPETKGKPLPE